MDHELIRATFQGLSIFVLGATAAFGRRGLVGSLAVVGTLFMVGLAYELGEGGP